MDALRAGEATGEDWHVALDVSEDFLDWASKLGLRKDGVDVRVRPVLQSKLLRSGNHPRASPERLSALDMGENCQCS